MSEFSFDEARTNQAANISGFGGHRLFGGDTGITATEAAADVAVPPLSELGIEDAEQLVAIAAIPEVRDEFYAAFGPDVEALVRRALEILPAERARAVGAPAPVEFGLGVLPPTPEILAAAEALRGDEAFTMAPAAPPPGSVNLIPGMPPIRNQGPRGTCVSFTLTALNEYVLSRRGIVRDLSEQHLYYEIKLIDGEPAGCGTWLVKAVQALRTRGQCREATWPYDPNPPCNNHGARPAAARQEGLQHRLPTVQVSAKDVAAYKRYLAQGQPVTISIPVYNSWMKSAETRRSGRITMRIGNEPVAGGHAVCLVGYQDSSSSPGGGYFLVRNSWHTTWASASPYGAGYGTLPYAYIATDAWEAFTATVPAVSERDDAREDEDGMQPAGRGEKTTITLDVGRRVKITIREE